MSQLHHRRRRAQQAKRNKVATLNLVSLMDIFTILVFFLMVNSSDVEILETSTDIKLPDSSSEQRPEQQIVISVSANDIIVQGRKVAAVSALEPVDGEQSYGVIESLKQELDYQAARKGEVPELGYEVTIMGDRELPYWLLKQIMMTCQTAEFSQISLAVNKPEGPVKALDVPEIQEPAAPAVETAPVAVSSVESTPPSGDVGAAS
jgi:biopolymer transport protein ExbD